MKYNFDELIDRSGTNASKREGYKAYIFHADKDMQLPFKDEDFIHMWVADMEFAAAPEIIEAIEKRLDRKIFGYTANTDSRFFDAINQWSIDKYDYSFNEADMVISQGIVPAIVNVIAYTLAEDEKVLFNTPAYGQFANAAKVNGRAFVTSALIKNEDGSYEIDFDDLEEKMSDPKTKLFILCNPHNPTGRAWTEEELRKIADLAVKNDIWVISDEIHCDLRRADAPKHIPLAKLMPEYDKLVTCMAASKTFNLAGLAESAIFIHNEDIKNKWRYYAGGLLNPLSHEANIAAYTQGGEWLNELIIYLDDNFKLMNEYLAEHLPDAIVTPSETTYLAWVDFRNYFEEDENIELFFAEKAGVLIEADKAFVDDADRMVRLNLACPRSYLKEGLERMADALNNNHENKFLGPVDNLAL